MSLALHLAAKRPDLSRQQCVCFRRSQQCACLRNHSNSVLDLIRQQMYALAAVRASLCSCWKIVLEVILCRPPGRCVGLRRAASGPALCCAKIRVLIHQHARCLTAIQIPLSKCWTISSKCSFGALGKRHERFKPRRVVVSVPWSMMHGFHDDFA